MKYYKYVFVLLFFIKAQAQDFYQNNVDADAPTVIPSSPEAATLGRYGNLPLNSSTGKMNFSVPIHTIEAGGQSWPISLQYNYSGLILEDKPSLMGLGWNLVANGAVVREVRGLPDEHDNGYYSTAGIVKGIIDTYASTGAMDLQYLRNKFYKGVWDSEVDKYTVNIGGVNFSFKIGENKKPVYLSRHNYQVTIYWNSSYQNQIDSFTVRDDHGVDYIFSEIERSIPYRDEELLLNPITSWNIYRIDYPNGQSIRFQYTPDDFTSYGFSARGAALLTDIQEDLTNNPVFFSPFYKEFAHETTIKRQILTRVLFSGGSIDLNLATASPRKTYESIEVKNSAGSVVNQYDFVYQGDRDELISITKNQEHFYEFEYYGTLSGGSTVPPFMQTTMDKPLAQDRWKYFNGANNAFALNVPSTSYTADLEPNFRNTSKGALRKVIYPTGGYTEVIYEQNQIKTNNVFNGANYAALDLNKTLKASLQLDGAASTNQHKETTLTYTFTNPTVATITHLATTNDIDNTHLVIQMERIDTCPYSNYYPPAMLPLPPYSAIADYNHFAPYLRQEIQRLNLEDVDRQIPIICPSLNFEWSPAGVGGAPSIEQGHSQGRVLIAPGTYQFKIYTDFNGYSQAYGEIILNFNLSQANEEPSPYVNENVGGIRVAELKDCFDENECYSRYFDYNDDDGFSTGALNVIPVKEVVHSWNTTHSNGTRTYVELHDFGTEAYTSLNPSFGTPVYYGRVKEYNSSQKNNGYKETAYESPTDISGHDYPSYPKGVDLDKGRVKSEKFYKFLSYHPNPIFGDSTAVELVQENSYKHHPFRGLYVNGMDANPNHPLSFKVVRGQNLNIDFTRHSYDLNPTLPGEINAVKALYQIAPYKELDLIHKKGQDKTKSIYVNDTVEQQTDYYYGNDDYRQLKSRITTDSRKETLELHYEYPYDNPDGGIYDAMVTSNQITSPVEIFKLKNNDTISRQKIDFKLANSQYKPEVIYTSKGSGALEARIQYNYDAIGNIKEVIRPLGDAISTSYIWGYNPTYPVAKIENATRAQIEALSEFSADFHAGTGGLTAGQETQLRGLANAMVTTYTYKPLIGVTSVTDPRGYTTSYEYDEFNRLSHVDDADDKVLKKYYYNYQGQKAAGYAALKGSISLSNATILQGRSENTTARADISGGSGSFSYSWQLNGSAVGSDSPSFSFSTSATKTVGVTILDLITGKTLHSEGTVTAHAPLSVPTLSSSKRYALTTQTITFTGGNISGGSGSKRYQWYVNNSKQSYTGTQYSRRFSKGRHTVKFRVVDTRISPTHYKERTYTVDVYNVMIPGSISSASTVSVNNYNTFSVSPGEGSGSFTYKWIISGRWRTYTSTSRSYKPKLTYDFYGPVTASCEIRDSKTGEVKTISRSITVNGARAPGVSLSYTSGVTSNTFRQYTTSGGGYDTSGHYSYRLYVDNQYRSSGTSAYGHVNCANKSDTIKLEVTDTRTGLKSSKTIVISIPGSCPKGGSGDDGKGNYY